MVGCAERVIEERIFVKPTTPELARLKRELAAYAQSLENPLRDRITPTPPETPQSAPSETAPVAGAADFARLAAQVAFVMAQAALTSGPARRRTRWQPPPLPPGMTRETLRHKPDGYG